MLTVSPSPPAPRALCGEGRPHDPQWSRGGRWPPAGKAAGWEGESLTVASPAGFCESVWKDIHRQHLAWLWSLTAVWVNVKTMWPVSWARG